MNFCYSGHRKTLTLAVALAFGYSLPSNAQVSYFSVDNSNATTGVMSLSTTYLGNTILSSPSSLTTGSNPFNYATVYFVPSSTGTYKFGQTAAPVDTIMILYQGVFSPTSPGTGALVGNDDTSQAIHRTTVGNPTLVTNCDSDSYCPQVTSAVVAGQRYSVLISTYDSGDPLGLPLIFYSNNAVSFYSAPPPSVGVYSSSFALGNHPALNGARVIDAHSNLLGLFGSLTTDQQVSDAASQTVPLLTGGTQFATGAALNSIQRIVQARLENNRGMSTGDDFIGNKNLWIKPFGSQADQENQSSVAGYKAKTYGIVFGVDTEISPTLRAGGAFAYARSDVDAKSTVAPQSANIDVYQLIGYGSYSLDERTEISLQADAGQNVNKGNRSIAFTSAVASSDYYSHTAHAGAGIARTYSLNSSTDITPSVRVDYTWIRDKSYTEKGADLLNLHVNSRSTDAFVISFDGKVSQKLNDQTSLTANFGVGYDAINKQSSITSAYAGAADAAFVTYGVDPDPWIGRAGLGLVYKTKTGVEITGRYDAEYRQNFLNQTASVKFRWNF